MKNMSMIATIMSAVRELRNEFLGLLVRVVGGQHLEDEVASGSRGAQGLVVGGLAEGRDGEGLGDGGEAAHTACL